MHQNSLPVHGESEDSLTSREAAFVDAYVAIRNATKAAETAGYSAKSAHVIGSRLLKKPRVAAAIKTEIERITRKYEVSAERTVQEMAAIGFSDLRHYHIDGAPIDCVTLAPGAPDGAMRAIRKVKRKTRTIPQKDGADVVEVETEIEFWSKDTQLKHLGDYLKLFKENRADDDPVDEITDDELREGVISILKDARERKRAAEAQAKTSRIPPRPTFAT